MRRMTQALPLFSIALLFLFAGPAFGQEEDEAYEEFVKANDLAGRGALTRAIPHYQKVIELRPEQYPLAYFNLAEVWKYKDERGKAALLYQAYLEIGEDAQTKKEARSALRQVQKGEKWPSLTIRIEPREKSTILVDGTVISTAGAIEDLRLPAGKYEIEGKAVDHHPGKETVELEEEEDRELVLELEEMTFYGTMIVKVDREGARIKIHARPDEKSKVVHELSSPMRKPVKLEEGRHFVEVTKSGYDRWIRNVRIRREEKSTIDVTLSRAKPEEIR